MSAVEIAVLIRYNAAEIQLIVDAEFIEPAKKLTMVLDKAERISVLVTQWAKAQAESK